MIAIVCIDSQNGLMFGGRRQSRDRCLVEDIRTLCGDKPLLMNEYSSRLFQQYGFSQVTVTTDVLEQASDGDFCFIEGEDLLPFRDKLEKLILYCWNRVYPADLTFNLSVLQGMRLTETRDFPGFSHKIITRKVYEG